MPDKLFGWPWRWMAVCGVVLGGALEETTAAEEARSEPLLPMVTNVLQFHRLAERTQRATCALRLAGAVRWASPDKGLLVLEDDSGAALVELSAQSPLVQAGQKVVLEGDCSGIEAGACLRIGRRLLINNDGAHGMEEKSGALFLTAGKHPLALSWYARSRPYGLEVYYQGPALLRRQIPASALFCGARDGAGGATWFQGIGYRAYAGQWSALPDFNKLTPIKSGTAANFDLAIQTRDKNLGLEFAGYLEVPADGLYTFSTRASWGDQLFIGLPSLRVMGAAETPAPRRVILGEILPEGDESPWVEAEGQVTFVSKEETRSGLKLELSSETGRMQVDLAEGSAGLPALLLNSRVRVTGICRSTHTLDGHRIPGGMWVPSLTQIEVVAASAKVENEGPGGAGQLPVLTSAEQVSRLTHEEAMRGYPVRIRGVVTWCARPTAFTIQDATQGVYVEGIATPDSYQLRVGEYWEVEGVTAGRFSPVILAGRVLRLGSGTLPEPIHPARDQLLNGAMDARYAEIQGLVTAVQGRVMILLTHEGRVQIRFTEMRPESLQPYEGALVRVRGLLNAAKDNTTFALKTGEVWMRGASINVDQPAPADPFSARSKRVAELLRFDMEAAAFQKVKVAGQIVHGRGGAYCLMDGTNGLRFLSKTASGVQLGDQVEVCGFPELDGPSPVLSDAVVRRIGHAGLPLARQLDERAPFNGEWDATLVRARAQLVNVSADRKDQVLELVMGTHLFTARLTRDGTPAVAVPLGSLLELSGVYASHGGDRAAGRDINSFELLLNSPADIRVLARPSWWTLNRLLAMVGVLGGVVAVAVVWIGLLRRQVEQRTRQLRQEIHERERAEHQRAVEAERSRIARDLHDDLGSTLTEISLLADAGPGSPPTLEKAGNRFHRIAEKGRSLVNALDVIVWLVNPLKDALPFLAGYLVSYTEEFLSASAVGCRVKLPAAIPALPLSAEVRHSIFLAVKEVLNNVVRHAHATEVVMEVAVRENRMEITISDNGCGFEPSVSAGGNGLGNIRERLVSVGGESRITSQPKRGTSVYLTLPLPAAAS